jgi:hypothetical protein
LRSTEVGTGRLYATTEREGVRIGLVRTELGPVVVVRVVGELEGDVTLDEEDGLPVAVS